MGDFPPPQLLQRQLVAEPGQLLRGCGRGDKSSIETFKHGRRETEPRCSQAQDGGETEEEPRGEAAKETSTA